MIRVLKWAGIGVVGLVVLFFEVGLLLPSEYSIARTVTIDAEPEQVHRLVGHLEQWPEWTPWLAMDPSIETTLGSSTTGIGAHQTWTGQSGQGELTFTRCDAASGVAYDMSFDAGKYKSVGAIDYAPSAAGTEVTWSMHGDSGMNIVGRYFGLMMDSMVGPAFESGLTKLKQKAEALPPAETETPEIEAEPVEKSG